MLSTVSPDSLAQSPQIAPPATPTGRRPAELQAVEPAPLLSVVIPMRDEADNVLALLQEVQTSLEGRESFEIVCVDDGSQDDTGLLLKRAQSLSPNLRCYRHAESCGQSAAIRTGILKARGKLVLTMDGDGQNDPADILPLLEALRSADKTAPVAMVTGVRRKRRDNAVKRFSSRIANALRSRALGDGILDSGCGIRLFARETYLRLPYFDHMHRFLPALVQRDGGRVLQLPVNHRPRLKGQSKYGLWDRLLVGIVDLFGVMWLQRRSRRPSHTQEIES